jgi:hypothetical protein
MITRYKSVSNLACEHCPIKGTEYCHKVNPMAKKYTRTEKHELREAIDKGQAAFKEAK